MPSASFSQPKAFNTSKFKSNLVYDVGLHKGEDTEFYIRKGFDVVGIEADPELISYCKIRFRDALDRGQLRIVEGAIAPVSAGDRINFYKTPLSILGTVDQTFVDRNRSLGYADNAMQVARIDVVDIYSSYGIPFYLKVDIEGADLLMLEGLKQFEDRPQFVSIEAEKFDFSDLQLEVQLLQELGYKKFKSVQQQTIPGSRIATQTIDGREIEHVFEPHSSGPFGDDIRGPWRSSEDLLAEYSMIFEQYRLFGDYSSVQKLPSPARKIVKALYKLWTGHRGPLPGWYDTHASL